MFTKKGVYVFPDEEYDCYHLFYYQNDIAYKLPSTTFAEQIIDFTEIDMSILEEIIIQLRAQTSHTKNRSKALK